MAAPVLFLLLLLGCSVSSQLLAASDNTIDNTTPASAIACKTARGLMGNCVDRQYCDFSTYGVDLSLYAPKGYKKPCTVSQVCCPTAFQLPEEPKKTWNEQEDDFKY